MLLFGCLVVWLFCCLVVWLLFGVAWLWIGCCGLAVVYFVAIWLMFGRCLLVVWLLFGRCLLVVYIVAVWSLVADFLAVVCWLFGCCLIFVWLFGCFTVWLLFVVVCWLFDCYLLVVRCCLLVVWLLFGCLVCIAAQKRLRCGKSRWSKAQCTMWYHRGPWIGFRCFAFDFGFPNFKLLEMDFGSESRWIIKVICSACSPCLRPLPIFAAWPGTNGTWDLKVDPPVAGFSEDTSGNHMLCW